jgi:hypothetical protein
LLKNIESKGVAVEIGSFKGRLTVCLAKALEEKNEGHLYTVDADILKIKAHLLKNIEGYGLEKWVTPVFNFSAIANRGWSRPINFLWLDTDGNYFSWLADFLLWEPHVVEGGVVALSGASTLSTERILKKHIIASGRFHDITRSGSIIFAYKSKQAKAYPAFQTICIRTSSLCYCVFRKFIYNLKNIFALF